MINNMLSDNIKLTWLGIKTNNILLRPHVWGIIEYNDPVNVIALPKQIVFWAITRGMISFKLHNSYKVTHILQNKQQKKGFEQIGINTFTELCWPNFFEEFNSWFVAFKLTNL